MLTRLGIKFPIQPIIDQVQTLQFDKRLALNETSGSLFSGPYTIKPEFINTPLGEVLQSLGNIGEARLLKLSSAETYTAHADPDDRIHLSIITNPYTYLQDLSNNHMYHLPADGELWLMDTGKVHVAANFGGRERIHLNVRVLLPEFVSPGILISFSGGDFDWKQELYISFMGYLNKAIKQGLVTGIEKVSDRELKLNADPKAIETIAGAATVRGFSVAIKNC